uniref:(northern house mosquito) hypothetical protein n=1 Tax=Culex pipiens TaxID=7175 RepID=A0A8D8JEH2_CULPI
MVVVLMVVSDVAMVGVVLRREVSFGQPVGFQRFALMRRLLVESVKLEELVRRSTSFSYHRSFLILDVWNDGNLVQDDRLWGSIGMSLLTLQGLSTSIGLCRVKVCKKSC